MEEKDGYLYIWRTITDEQFDYYDSKYEYIDTVYYHGRLALKFKV